MTSSALIALMTPIFSVAVYRGSQPRRNAKLATGALSAWMPLKSVQQITSPQVKVENDRWVLREIPKLKEQMIVCGDTGEMNWERRQCVMMPQRLRSKEKQWDFPGRLLLVTSLGEVSACGEETSLEELSCEP